MLLLYWYFGRCVSSTTSRGWTLVSTGRLQTRCLFISGKLQKVKSRRGLAPSQTLSVASICYSSPRHVVCVCCTSTLGTFGALLGVVFILSSLLKRRSPFFIAYVY